MVFYLRGATTILEDNLPQHPAITRTSCFIAGLRGSMLVNGMALDRNYVNVQRVYTNPGNGYGPIFRPRIIVWCDDSWDAATETHVHHEEHEESEYDPP